MDFPVPLSMIAIGTAATFCIVQAVRDALARHYAWAAVAGFCGALLLLTPIPTHAIKFDLPAAGS